MTDTSLREALADVLALVDDKQHMFATQQMVLRKAREVLAATAELETTPELEAPFLALGTGVTRTP